MYFCDSSAAPHVPIYSPHVPDSNLQSTPTIPASTHTVQSDCWVTCIHTSYYAWVSASLYLTRPLPYITHPITGLSSSSVQSSDSYSDDIDQLRQMVTHLRVSERTGYSTTKSPLSFSGTECFLNKTHQKHNRDYESEFRRV
jgi:hypothetical protein